MISTIIKPCHGNPRWQPVLAALANC